MIEDPKRLVGERLDQYEIKGLIKETAKSWVFEARDNLKRKVTLKVLKPGQSLERQEQFLREGERLASLTHSCLTTVFSSGEDKGLQYLSMEYVEGPDLYDSLKSGRKFSLEEIVDLVGGIADGLDFMHSKGIQHNDIKLKNIKERKDKPGVYILDLGGRLTRVEKSGLMLTR